MFTREDYHKYLQEVAGIERMMIYFIKDLLPRVEDHAMHQALLKVSKDEVSHYESVITLFNETMTEGEDNKRHFIRQHALGKVSVKGLQTHQVFEGYCANFSEGGIGIEFFHEKPLEEELEIKVHFFDSQESKTFLGQMVWEVQVDSQCRMGRINAMAGLKFL